MLSKQTSRVGRDTFVGLIPDFRLIINAGYPADYRIFGRKPDIAIEKKLVTKF